MAFYFRKTKRLGPLSLNLSKRGLGLSGGSRRARLSIGPERAAALAPAPARAQLSKAALKALDVQDQIRGRHRGRHAASVAEQ